MTYQYQDSGYFAQAPGMMEELCEEELIELGAKDTKVPIAEFISRLIKRHFTELTMHQDYCQEF